MTDLPHPTLIMTPAVLLGLVFDLVLFGILTAQVYVYYTSFPGDRILLKISVVWVYLAGVAQIGLVLFDVNLLLAEELFLRTMGWGVFSFDHFRVSITFLTGVVAVIIQSLYAYRIYLLSKKRWLATMIISMTLGQFANSIIGFICFRREGAIVPILETLSNPPEARSIICRTGFTLMWGPLNIVCDLTITICMVTLLLRHRKRVMTGKTRFHLTRIIQIVIETGLATTISMITYTVLFITWNSVISFTYFALPGVMMSKVYSNSMLVLLNNRATIVNGRNAPESFEFVEVSAQLLEGGTESRSRGQTSAAGMPE